MSPNTRAHLLYAVSDFNAELAALEEKNRGDCVQAIKLRAAIKQLRLMLETL